MAGIAAALVAGAVGGGGVWVRIVVFLAVLVGWALMLHHVFGLRWSRITRYKEPTAGSAESGAARTRR